MNMKGSARQKCDIISNKKSAPNLDKNQYQDNRGKRWDIIWYGREQNKNNKYKNSLYLITPMWKF